MASSRNLVLIGALGLTLAATWYAAGLTVGAPPTPRPSGQQRQHRRLPLGPAPQPNPKQGRKPAPRPPPCA
jgi:hypothetical protein